jgi:hypothetical protein
MLWSMLVDDRVRARFSMHCISVIAAAVHSACLGCYLGATSAYSGSLGQVKGQSRFVLTPGSGVV